MSKLSKSDIQMAILAMAYFKGLLYTKVLSIANTWKHFLGLKFVYSIGGIMLKAGVL